MTHDEYQAAIAELIKGGDDAADKGAALLKSIDDDAAAAADKESKATEKAAADAATISDLNKKIAEMKTAEFMNKTGKPEQHNTENEVEKILRGVLDPFRPKEKEGD